VWPISPRMADNGGSGGVRWGPELLGHHRWTGGIEGGAVEERMRHASVDEGDRVKKGGRAAPFMAARWRGREKGARGPKLKGARAVSCGHAARGGAGGGGSGRRQVPGATALGRAARGQGSGVSVARYGENGWWAGPGK
jgi:hypothetical protein